MTTLSLTEEEQDLLTQVLDQDLRELGNEINHTDDNAFKARLRDRERVLRGLLTRLGGAARA
jgi:hypothetical protein